MRYWQGPAAGAAAISGDRRRTVAFGGAWRPLAAFGWHLAAFGGVWRRLAACSREGLAGRVAPHLRGDLAEALAHDEGERAEERRRGIPERGIGPERARDRGGDHLRRSRAGDAVRDEGAEEAAERARERARKRMMGHARLSTNGGADPPPRDACGRCHGRGRRPDAARGVAGGSSWAARDAAACSSLCRRTRCEKAREGARRCEKAREGGRRWEKGGRRWRAPHSAMWPCFAKPKRSRCRPCAENSGAMARARSSMAQ